MGVEEPRRQGHSKDKGAEVRMSLAGSRAARRPLWPEPHGPEGRSPLPNPEKQCGFLSGDTGSHEECVIELIMIIPFF